MNINRTLWKLTFNKDRSPQYPCPRCGIGVLKLQDDLFKVAQLADSPKLDSEEFEPTLIMYIYTAMFECTNESCKEHVSSCGKGDVEEWYDEYDLHYEDRFTPEYFFPPLSIFSIPPTCPETIATEIKASFRLFFSDPSASANHIRKSVENILTDKGIKRFNGNNGKRKIITLHDRIRSYAAKDNDVAERLFAIKWLGNAGSHVGELMKDDVLDAYEILETVIDDLYVGHGKSIKKKVALLNKRKGPLAKRRK